MSKSSLNKEEIELLESGVDKGYLASEELESGEFCGEEALKIDSTTLSSNS